MKAISTKVRRVLFEIVIRKILGKYRPSFELGEFKVVVNEPSISGANSSAMIKINVDGQYEITAMRDRVR